MCLFCSLIHNAEVYYSSSNQRVYCSSASTCKLHHESHRTLQRSSKLKLWSAESMDQAMNTVLNEGMSTQDMQLSIMLSQNPPWRIGSVKECYQALLVDQDRS